MQKLNYKLKRIVSFRESSVAVRFEYEWQNAAEQSIGVMQPECWSLIKNNLMQKQFASINESALNEKDRKLK